MLGKKLEYVLQIIVIQMIGFLILLQLNNIGMFQNQGLKRPSTLLTHFIVHFDGAFDRPQYKPF